MYPKLPAVQILLFFCTCNPPHIGHSEAIRSALANIPSIKKVLVFPPLHHVWGKEIISFEHRFAMARIAFEPLDPRIKVTKLEAISSVSGYSIDTIPLIERLYPGERIGMLVGADTLDSFPKWKRWKEILHNVVVLVAPRGEILQAEVMANIPSELKPYSGQQIFFLPDSQHTRALDASSTLARIQISQGSTLEVTPAVLAYIQENHLFESDLENP